MRSWHWIVVGLLLVAGLTWRMWPRDKVMRQETLPRPSEVRGPKVTAVRLRPKETPATATRLEKQKPAVSQLVKVAIGRDEATARRYVARSEAVWQLGNTLPEEEVSALLGYLRSTEDVLREERVDALKNDIMNVLRAQERTPKELAETLIAMFDSQAYGEALLDYCVQHLGALQETTANVTERRPIYDCLRRASLVPGASYAGTALIALTHTPNENDEQRHFVNERVAALVYAEDTHEAAKTTAVQIAAERGCTELLPVIRRIAADQSTAVTLRIVAIGALGTFREARDVTLLERLKADAPNPRLRPAIARAIERFQETQEPR